MITVSIPVQIYQNQKGNVKGCVWQFNRQRWRPSPGIASNIASNANKSLGFLKRNLKVSNPNIKSKAYQALVRPKLEYSCSVWDPHQSQHTHKLEMVQRRAARFVCNNYHNTSSVTDMVNTLQWPPLAERRLKSRLVIFYKIVHCLIAVL